MQTAIEFKPWARAKLITIIKDFPKPRQDQQLFIEKFRILLSAYDPELPDLYRLYIRCSES